MLSAATGTTETALDPDSYVADRVLIKLRDFIAQPSVVAGDASGFTLAVPASVSSILAGYGGDALQPIFPTAIRSSLETNAAIARGERAPEPARDAEGEIIATAASVGLDRWFQIDVAAGSDLSELLAVLNADAAVEFAEPDYYFRLADMPENNTATPLSGPMGPEPSSSAMMSPRLLRRPITESSSVQATGTGSGLLGTGGTASGSSATLPSATTDPLYGQQWHLDAINAPAAWAYLDSLGLPPGGSPDVVIAVIDTGVDYNHPDLAANMWVNAAEIPGNGIDDDGNGFVDDIHGVSVVSNTQFHIGDPNDDHGHGTHVAGIAAASANNNEGGVGVAYGSTIMAIKALQNSGVGTSTDVAEAVLYAFDNNATIINLSLGSFIAPTVIEDALRLAYSKCVIVAAAGNQGFDNIKKPFFPASYNWVVGVEAASASGGRAFFSNYDPAPYVGWEYEVLAPGVDVLSDLPGASYASWDGTSMATPVVAGVAALLRGAYQDVTSYSSRFVMGQLTINGTANIIDAYSSITQAPQPYITVRDSFVNDSVALDIANNGDGVINAGECIDIAVILKNRWGKASDVSVVLDVVPSGTEIPDPYADVRIGSVSIGALGSFGEASNGIVYGSDGEILSIENPFRVSIDPTTPNDHVISLRFTITARNGLDTSDSTAYTFTRWHSFRVQNGTPLPSVFTEDTVLGSDRLWIVEGPVLIPEGITVNVGPGAHIQWGGSEPVSAYEVPRIPYIKVEGSLVIAGEHDDRVQLYPSAYYLEEDQNGNRAYHPNVRIYNYGTTTIDFADITSPEFGHQYNIWLADRYVTPFITSISRSTLRRGSAKSQILTSDYKGWGNWSYSGGTIDLFAAAITESIIDIGPTVGLLNQGPGFHWDLRFRTTEFDTVLFKELNVNNGATELGFGELLSGGGFLHNSVLYGASFSARSQILLNSQGNSAGDAAGTHWFDGNAVLNPYWDPDSRNWLKIVAPSSGQFADLGIIDFGTQSNTLIDVLLEDVSDDFNLGTIAYSAAGASGIETAYPYVVDITTKDSSGNPTNVLGAGTASFEVRFNRDMDQTVEPRVFFGPDAPFSDYRLASADGGWIDARTWTGSFEVTPLTGDGRQFLWVYGATAVDKPWLVVDDEHRFGFTIATVGSESLSLQAVGGEGKISLSWQQSDFDLLAGFNVYRANALDGEYVKQNTLLIPASGNAFIDGDVQPGVDYFYKFRVVLTDGDESGDSNIAAAAALDTIPPEVLHNPSDTGQPFYSIVLRADVTDNVAVKDVLLNYRAIGASAYQQVAMINTSGDRYSATIDGDLAAPPGLEYFISATDGVSTVYSGSAAQPHTITIADRPFVTTITPAKGPAGGGTAITLVGSNFKVGASVSIGGVAATDVVVVSSTKITATTPAGSPAAADVAVVNPDNETHTLLGGFTYESDDAIVSLPALDVESGSTIEIGLGLADVVGLLSAEVVISFDAAVIQATAARVGPLANGWSLATNTNTAGEVKLTLANATSVSATGILAYVTFDVVGDPLTSSAVTVSSISLNAGAITTQITNGSVSVKPVHAIDGLVRYFSDNTPIEGVALALDGKAKATTTTNGLGAYAFASLQEGDYTLAPSKSDDVQKISAFDAVMVLQSVAGLTTLSANETIVADVNRRDGVNALDAAYILQKSVGLIPGNFPNAGASWVFSPDVKTFTDLTADKADQNFTGYLLGDVSGNWAEGLGGGGTATGAGAPTPTTLAIGSASVNGSGGKVQLPVEITKGDNDAYSADLVITYDPTKVSVGADPVSLGAAGTGMAYAVNADKAGEIRIAVAGTSVIAANGDLLLIDFDVASGLADDVVISLSTAQLDEGRVDVSMQNGTIVLDTVAPTAAFENVTSPRNAALDSIAVEFSEVVSGLSMACFTLKHDGVEVPLTNATLSSAGTTFTISDLATLTETHGDYELVLAANAATIVDAAGNSMAVDANVTWSLDTSITVGEGEESTDDTTRTGNYKLVKRGKGRLILDKANSHTRGTIVEAGEVVVRNIAALGTGVVEVRDGASLRFEIGTNLIDVSSLVLGATGVLDIGTAGFRLAAGSFDAAGVRQWLIDGRNGGQWNGSKGIMSSGSTASSGIGYVIDSAGVLTARLTSDGDSNLDSAVDFDDILKLFPNYNQTSGTFTWQDGDFNYDGKVDFDDILKLFPNYGK